MQEQHQYLTTADVAKRLGLTTPRIRQLADAGRIPSVRTASGWRLFAHDDVERIAQQREAQSGPEAR